MRRGVASQAEGTGRNLPAALHGLRALEKWGDMCASGPGMGDSLEGGTAVRVWVARALQKSKCTPVAEGWGLWRAMDLARTKADVGLGRRGLGPDAARLGAGHGCGKSLGPARQEGFGFCAPLQGRTRVWSARAEGDRNGGPKAWDGRHEYMGENAAHQSGDGCTQVFCVHCIAQRKRDNSWSYQREPPEGPCMRRGAVA